MAKTKSKTPKKHKRVHKIEVSRAKSGHLVAIHKHKPIAAGETPEDETHIVSDGKMDEHLDQHLPVPQDDEDEEEEGEQGSQGAPLLPPRGVVPGAGGGGM